MQTNRQSQVMVEASMEGFPPRKQIGLLGGSFNPVHYTHLLIADQVKQSLGLDRVDLLPSFLPPHVDEKSTIPAKHRVTMVERAIATNQNLGVETSEIYRQGKSYTYDTIKALREEHPDTDYFFIIGGDMVEYLPKWYKIDELLTMVQFVGVKRPDYPTTSDYPLIWVDVPDSGISSSLIRSKRAQGCSIRYFVPDSVLEYIQEEGLYLNE